MSPQQFLRVEGLTILGAALGLYLMQDGPLWLLVVLGLAPDISMLGYLLGPRRGSLVYNVIHIYFGPLLLGMVALSVGSDVGVWVALIWVAHIGADRAFGYGLKFESGFTDTHLSTQPKPDSAID